jgi:hypothetical protein
MLAIDMKNAFHYMREDNFTVLLLRLIAKADSGNRKKLARAYPVEVAAVDIYKNNCPYKDKNHTEVDWDRIAVLADPVLGPLMEKR